MKKIMDALYLKGYQVSCFETKEEAAAYLESQFDGVEIGFGDSATLNEMKINEKLSVKNTVWDPNKTKTTEEFLQVAKKCLTTRFFLTSVNAMSEDGVLINMDGSGNRVAGSLFGHEKVYFVVGKNKITANTEEAIWRVRNIAAPRNAKRLGKKTPCAVNGDRCYDCKSQDRICNGLLVYLRKMSNIEMEVILVNEILGL